VLVQEETSAETYEVDVLNRTCTCSTQPRPCLHLRRATDIHSDGCKRTRFEIVSAMHKEIRRGDVEAALYWADLLSRYSEGYVRNYVRRIVGEETRNWPLFMRALSPGVSSYRELVAAIASSRKKWEHKEGRRLFEEQMRAYDRETYAALPWPEVVSKLTAAIDLGDVPRLYDAWTTLDSGENAEAACAMDRILVAAVENRFPEIAGQPTAFMSARERHGEVNLWETRLTLVEMLAGAWDSSMNDFAHAPEPATEFNDGSVLRRFPPYVYDCHVREGARRLAEHGDEIAPRTPQPDGLDLRWSGQIEGVAWRYAAYAQFGDAYSDVAWERVDMTSDYWDRARAFQAAIEEDG
jgi:hypothetical protein